VIGVKNEKPTNEFDLRKVRVWEEKNLYISEQGFRG
jgi:hypothetical protein